MDHINATEYLRTLKTRKSDKQPTFHQQLGVETAEALNDMAHVSLYVRLFKKHRWDRPKLIECREWVLKQKGVRKPGALFMVTYQKFINPKPYQPN